MLGMIRRPGRIVGGAIRFGGVDLLRLSEDEMRAYRGRRIAMISQSPRTALNPVISVGHQISRLVEIHEGRSRSFLGGARSNSSSSSASTIPARRAKQYAHQLSGGMCQRVMIAMALATSPQLLIADEPTTGLDVSIAARILDLLREFGARTGAAIILITHDLGVVAETCGRVAVMHAGQLVEAAPGTRAVPFPRPSLYARVGALDPPRRRQSETGAYPRIGSVAASSASRLPVPEPLPGRHANVSASQAGRGRRRPRP